MTAAKRSPRRSTVRKPLEAGQLWRLGEAELKIEMVGKLLVHYRLALPKAVRVAISVSSITSLEKYMKANKAVLVKG
jgi:hypothetical protein